MSRPVVPRLSGRTQSMARAVSLPTYDRTAPPSVVHLGVGSFARAHLGVYADDLSRLGWSALIHGVSIKSRSVIDTLGPQDGLYSVSEREPGVPLSPRVIGSLAQVEAGVAAA